MVSFSKIKVGKCLGLLGLVTQNVMRIGGGCPMALGAGIIGPKGTRVIGWQLSHSH